MNLARELERRLERLVDGVSGALFGGRVHPVDLGTRLIREADLNVTEGPAGPVVPNDYKIALCDEDLAALAAPERLTAELEFTLNATAADRGWRLEGPATVTVLTDAAIKPHHVTIATRVTPGPIKPWGQLIGSGRHANLEPNRVLLGRAEECDIILPEPEVSRRHAVIHRGQHRAWVTDLGSANGTTVDGIDVMATAALRPGARLTLGSATFMFRLVEP